MRTRAPKPARRAAWAGIAAGALLLFALAAVAAWQLSPPPVAAPADEEAPPSTRPVARGVRPRVGSPRVGDLERRSLEVEAEVGPGEPTGPGAAPPGAGPTLALEMSGPASELVVDVAGDRVVSLIELPEVRAAHRTQPYAPPARVLVERDGRGRPMRLRPARGTPPRALQAAAAVVGLLQASTPEAPGADGFVVEEPTHAGTVSARYTPAADGAGWSKRVEAAGGKRGRALEVTLEGTLSFERAPGSRAPDWIEGSIVESSSARGAAGAALRSALRLRQARVAAEVDEPRAVAVAQTMDAEFDPWTTLDAIHDGRGIDPEALSELVGAHDLASVLGLVRAGPGERSGATSLGAVLHAWLMLHPETAGALAAEIRGLDLQHRGAHAAFRALAGAGHPDAQQALSDLAAAWRDRPDGPNVVAALGSVTTPTAATEAFLRSAATDQAAPTSIGTTAALALGSIAGKVRGADAARGQAIEEALEQRLRAGTEPHHIAVGLAALGNARSPRAQELAPRYLTHEEPIVRRMAIYALSRAGSPQSRDLLDRIAGQDEDQSVRDAAREALATLADRPG